jgi:peptidyl-dipeptidase Dcp
MPPEWVDRLRGASRHNQGFKTTEFIAAALLDLAWHGLDAAGAAAIPDSSRCCRNAACRPRPTSRGG